MFKWFESRVFWGLVLIAAGAIFLLQNLFDLELGGAFWAAMFALGGAFFVALFASNRLHWWALIPGFTLWGIAATIFVERYAPVVAEAFGGILVLLGISLGFLVIYLTDRRNWWSIIPGGVLLALVLALLLEDRLGDSGFITVFFLGMGVTFGLVALIPTPQGRMRWAWIPAGVLFLMGLVFSIGAGPLFGYAWPIALILGGLYLIYRTLALRGG